MTSEITDEFRVTRFRRCVKVNVIGVGSKMVVRKKTRPAILLEENDCDEICNVVYLKFERSREEELLVELVRKRRSILENKKTDAVMWKKKEACWVDLTDEFNSEELVFPRTVNQLQLKYKNLKRQVRKKSAKATHESRWTGGGLDETEKKLKEMIVLSVDGIHPTFDSEESTEHLRSGGETTNFLTRKKELASLKKKCLEEELKSTKEKREERKTNAALEKELLLLDKEKKILQIQKLKLEIEVLQKTIEG